MLTANVLQTQHKYSKFAIQFILPAHTQMYKLFTNRKYTSKTFSFNRGISACSGNIFQKYRLVFLL